MSTNQAYWLAAQTGRTPLGIGMPGIGKTESVYAFARKVKRQCYTLIGSLRDPGDVGGYPAIQTTKDGDTYMALIPPKYATDAQSGKWIIFIDEITTCPAQTQAALLRVIAEKHVGDLPLPKDTWILAACNPPDQAAGGHSLEAAMANRMIHLDWKVSWDDWDTGILNGLEFPEPDFPVLPADWCKGLGEAGSLVAAFRRHRPGHFADFPRDAEKQSGAWPSPRSWTCAVEMIAACRAAHASRETEYELLAGCIGEGAAGEFVSYRDNLDLGDPEEYLKIAMKSIAKGEFNVPYEKPDRPDKEIALLTAVASRVLQKNTPERWDAGMSLIVASAKTTVDVAMICAKQLAKNMPEGHSGHKKIMEQVVKLVSRAAFGSQAA